MYHLSGCNRDLFIKVTVAIFYFCHSKNSSNIMKNIFIPSLYIPEEKLLVSKYWKQMCYKENKYLIF